MDNYSIIPKSKGRKNLFERLFNNLFQTAEAEPEGSQRSLSSYWAFSPLVHDPYTRNYDQEIEDYNFVRSPGLAQQLWDISTNCSEAATCIDIINSDAWSSADGSNIGFDIADTLNDNETKIDPTVESILRRLIDDVLVYSGFERIGELMLATGDAFVSLGVNTKKHQIDKLLILPTWEMFRVEDNQANLLRFEQRPSLMENQHIHLHPIACVHWRYRRQSLYGRALFRESIFDWCKLKPLLIAIEQAAMAVGVNPNVHILPCETRVDEAESYKRNHEEARSQGLVLDYYMLGGDVKKLANINPDIKSLVEAANLYITRIVRRSRVPPWMVGLPSIGAREISGGPERAYARLINHFRQDITVGLRHIFNMELALHGIPKSEWKYRIKYPIFYVEPYLDNLPREDLQAKASGIHDLDTMSVTTQSDIAKQIQEILNGNQYREMEV